MNLQINITSATPPFTTDQLDEIHEIVQTQWTRHLYEHVTTPLIYKITHDINNDMIHLNCKATCEQDENHNMILSIIPL